MEIIIWKTFQLSVRNIREHKYSHQRGSWHLTGQQWKWSSNYCVNRASLAGYQFLSLLWADHSRTVKGQLPWKDKPGRTPSWSSSYIRALQQLTLIISTIYHLAESWVTPLQDIFFSWTIFLTPLTYNKRGLCTEKLYFKKPSKAFHTFWVTRETQTATSCILLCVASPPPPYPLLGAASGLKLCKRGFEEPGARENVSYESITTIRIQSYFQ